MRILIYVNKALRGLGAACGEIPGIEAVVAEHHNDLPLHLPDADALVLSNSTYSENVAKCLRQYGRRLKWIQFTSVGLNAYERLGAPQDIAVCNAPGLRAAAVAEHAFALLVAMTRRIVAIDKERSVGDWDRSGSAAEGMGLLNDTELHCLGYGNIGQRVSVIARAFGARVVAYNRSGNGLGVADEVLPLDRLRERLPDADSIVLCLPATAQTRGLLGSDMFGRLKRGVYLVNVGRGDLIDTGALLGALDNGIVAGAGLDVFETEPLSADSPLWLHPQVLMTPHVGGNGGDPVKSLAELIASGCERIKGGLLPFNDVRQVEKTS